MIRRLLISEQEKQSILKSHGLLSEIAGDEYLVLPNYSVQKVLVLTQAVKNSGYNDISDFKKSCINTNTIGLSKKERKNLLLNINNQWDTLADKCMGASQWTTEYDREGNPTSKQIPNKVYVEYQKILEKQKLEKETIEELRKKLPTLNPTLKNLAQDYLGYKDRKYCPNFSIEYTKDQTFRCDINNEKFGVFHQYDKGGNLKGSPLSRAFLYGVLQPKERLTYESDKKINEFINSQSGGLVGSNATSNENGEIYLDFLNVKNYDDVKKLYEILENLSSKSDEIRSLAIYEKDNTKKWVKFLNETDNKKYCSNIDINFTGTQLSCSFDIAKTSEPGKFKIDWEIYKERITINELSYTLTEEEKDQTTKEKIATYFAKNIPKGFEGMVAFFSPFFLKNEKYKDKLVFQPSITEINFDDIKLFYVYINNMDQGVKNKEYLKT